MAFRTGAPGTTSQSPSKHIRKSPLGSIRTFAQKWPMCPIQFAWSGLKQTTQSQISPTHTIFHMNAIEALPEETITMKTDE
jgi:hypothetical protein